MAKADATLVALGWTNRRALLAGARDGETVTVGSRAQARAWVRSERCLLLRSAASVAAKLA